MSERNEYLESELISPLEKDLIKLLAERGALTRDQIILYLRKPRTTIYDSLTKLIGHDLVKKYSRPLNKRSRPPIYFKLMDGVKL